MYMFTIERLYPPEVLAQCIRDDNNHKVMICSLILSVLRSSYYDNRLAHLAQKCIWLIKGDGPYILHLLRAFLTLKNCNMRFLE